MSKLPWDEKVAMLSINPDAASSSDVAQLASELMNCHQQDRLKTREINTLVPENRNLLDALRKVVDVWEHQSGRVFESMGSQNPRAQAICEAIEEAARLLPERRVCKACGCTIDVHGCGCNPHDA